MTIVFRLRLGDNGSPLNQSKYFRLPPPSDAKYHIQFLITSGALASNSPILYTNYPENGPLKFHSFRLSDPSYELEIALPGCYEYYVEYITDDGTFAASERGRFVVEPRLYLPKDSLLTDENDAEETLLPLDGINILTIIPKWMPTVRHWAAFFQAFSDAGYNMVHFAPINTRGISNSPYAIYDQLSISDDLFDTYHTEDVKEKEFKHLIQQIKSRDRILSITDIVWNHTACNSPWLLEHPEAGYNLITAPHLRPAYELDAAILEFSENLSEYGLPIELKTEGQLNEILKVFKEKVFSSLKLWEFYTIDVESSCKDFASLWSRRNVKIPLVDGPVPFSIPQEALALKSFAFFDPLTYLRHSKYCKVEKSVLFMEELCKKYRISNEKEQLSTYKSLLDEINLAFYKEWDDDKDAIISGIFNRAKFLRIEAHGPRLGVINSLHPLVDTYFTRLPRNEITSHFHPDELALANNGWIWNADPLVNFAGPQSKAYLRREVIAWGDCVKLRYGNGREDNPWLWDHQTKYTLKMASIFHGFRIDNCHSTPIHVAAYLLDKARELNPDLYVMAELFTGSEEKDITFVAKLGINSLIREAMQAWDPNELSRLVHRFGGNPVGSFSLPVEQLPLQLLGHNTHSDFYHSIESSIFVDIKGSTPHALLMDCTHDNETPHQKRMAEDSLTNAAITAMSICAIGSVKGYDELVPELLNVVSETRKYRLPRRADGILPAKSEFALLHRRLAEQGFSEIHVHQEHEFISIHRVHPVTHEGYLLIARCAFKNCGNGPLHSPIKLRNQRVEIFQSANLKINGESDSPKTAARSSRRHSLYDVMEDNTLSIPLSPTQFYHSMEYEADLDDDQLYYGKDGLIFGLPCTLQCSNNSSSISKTEESVISDDGQFETIITFNESFVPGSCVIYRTWMAGSNSILCDKTFSLSLTNSPTCQGEPLYEILWEKLGMDNHNNGIKFMLRMGYEPLSSPRLWLTENDTMWPPGLQNAVKPLNMTELNLVLYRTDIEERDTLHRGAYNIPGYGPLAYCGIQGFISALLDLAYKNDTGHPMCSNIRQGPWMIDYITSRLELLSQDFPAIELFYIWIKERLEMVKTVAPSFMPKYFAIVLFLAYQGLKYKAVTLQTLVKPNLASISSSTYFAQELYMTAIQLFGSVSSTGLFPKAYPVDIYDKKVNVIGKWRLPCLAAGLDHFTTEYLRCWGRDIFISLRGLFIIPGHYNIARAHIIAFGSNLLHGLIPNLLDQGIRPRYNARDATWFWLAAVAQYCRSSPEGYDFLNAVVYRRFVPSKRYTSGPDFCKVEDDSNSDADKYIPPSDERVFTYQNTIAELCHEILERHARGISFREWNAGPNLDHAMSWQGFEINIKTKFDQGGWIFGGNLHNCGTWMDKMGDSEKAGTKGVPATPRDGCPIEIAGLIAHFISWICTEASLHETLWPWKGVVVDGNLITYNSWHKKLLDTFEKSYFIPNSPSEDGNYQVDSKFVKRRGIYKDTLGSQAPKNDYQFRPNMCIAMVMAPKCFDPANAREALENIKNTLLGPLGMKTLDPEDENYRGYYDNTNDSHDPSVAHGFNYHNGPEWIWVTGYFLRAYHYFFTIAQGHDPLKVPAITLWISRVLLQHKKLLHDAEKNPKAGLPELTNMNGEYCHGSCTSQAWSSATLLELMYDLTR